MRRLCWLTLLLLWCNRVTCRPKNIYESDQSVPMRFLSGIGEGIVGVLSFAGLDEDEEEAAEGSSSDEDYDDSQFHVETENSTTIQIVGLGLGRTGTTSLVLALEILGYNVIHDDEHLLLTDVYTAYNKKDITWDEFHEIAGRWGYNVSFKTNYEWVQERPDVKAILTVRDDANKYVASWTKAAKWVEILEKRPFCWMKMTQELLPSFTAEYKDEPTGGEPEKYLDPETLRKNYEAYNAEVISEIPAERLLVFNVKQGWKPLCDFLGHAVPENVPFPHVHDRVKLTGEILVYDVVCWCWPLAIILPLALFTHLMNRIMSYRKR